MCDCPGIPRYCFGSTAIFIIVFCLLCSLSTLGPRFIDLDQQSTIDKEYPEIDTSTCQIQPIQPPDHEVHSNFLTSYPGSGARMLSRLVEALTGIPTTDDVYSNGVSNTVGINTYYPCPEGQETPGADSIRRAAILIRHPLDAIPGYHNLLYHQMNKNLPVAPEDDWAIWSETKLLLQIEVWAKHLEYWVDRYPAKNRLVVSYDQLLSPARGPRVTKELAEFLNLSDGVVTIPPRDVPCVWQRLVDEYELTLPPSERQRRFKRALPRKSDRLYESSRPKVQQSDRSGGEQVEEQSQEVADNENGSNRGGGDQEVKAYKSTNQQGDEQSYDQSKGKANRLGGKRQPQFGDGADQQKVDQETQQVATARLSNRRVAGSNSDQQEGDQESQSENVGGNQEEGTDQQETKAQVDEESAETGKSRQVGENSERSQDNTGSDQQDGSKNDEQSNEISTQRRNSAQTGRANDKYNAGENEGKQNAEATTSNEQRRRRLSYEDSGIFDNKQQLQNEKIFPVEGRKELLTQLSRLLEKYHRDDNIAGMLVEYIDELERRHPTN